MILRTSPSIALRIVLFLLTATGLLLVSVGMQFSRVRAERDNSACGLEITPTRTKRPEKLTPTPTAWQRARRSLPTPASSKLCGELVYLTGYYPIYNKPTVSTIGLIPCGSGKPYIFGRHPRDLVRYFQFRDPGIGTGKMICTEEYGCLDQYITSFKNYIGLESCEDCGKRFLPTWTLIPLTPYTPTPIPPTRTSWPTPPSSTPTRTLAPGEVTSTLSLFEILYGTFTPTSSAVTQVQPILTETPTPQATISTPEVTPTPERSLVQRLWPIALILFALLIFLIPLVSVLRDLLRER